MTLGFRLTQLLSTWQLVGRRILAHWRLLSPVVVGVLLASAMMAGTVLYFDSLRDLALQFTLDKLPEADVNVILVTEKGPTNADEYDAVSSILVERMDPLVGWTARRVGRTGKSAVFAVASPDRADDPSAWDGDGRANFIFVTGLGDDAAMLPGGRMPEAGAARGPGEPLELEAMAPADQAEAFGLAVGDRIAAIPATTGPTPHVLVTITGLFEAPEDATALRDLDERVLRRGTQVNFRQLQLYISEETYLETLGPSFPRLDSIYAWHLDVDRGRLNSRNSRDTLVGLIFLSDRLGSSLYGYEQITGLDDALREFERRHFFTKLPMLVAMILIVIVILYYIVMIASMVVARQRGEIVLMRSRGATSTQIFMVFLIEAGTLSLAAALVGPLIAGLAIGSLGYTPAFSELTGGDALPVDISGASYGLSAVGALLAFAALLVPAVQASRVGVARYRQESARPARQPWFQKYYVDVAGAAGGAADVPPALRAGVRGGDQRVRRYGGRPDTAGDAGADAGRFGDGAPAAAAPGAGARQQADVQQAVRRPRAGPVADGSEPDALRQALDAADPDGRAGGVRGERRGYAPAQLRGARALLDRQRHEGGGHLPGAARPDAAVLPTSTRRSRAWPA